jgi:hypothetical protein
LVDGWVQGLGNPNVSIGYDYGIYDAANPTTLIPENSTVPSGKQVILKFNPYVPDNIFWFGTGYSLDSPFGEWRVNATPPARVSNKVTCDSKDLTGQYTTSITGSYTFDVYIPLVVNPAARALGQLNGLSCGALTSNPDGSASAACTVTGSGTINPTFDYGSTYGKFYYRYTDQRDMTSIGWGGPGCYGNNIPLSQKSSLSSPYVLSVASQSFAYPLTVGVPTNTAPNQPTLTCPVGSVTAGQDVSVTVSATDPESDQVRYGVDWLNTGSVNSGWTGYVPSGTAQTLTKIGGYSSAGAYTVTAWAQDSNGAQSAPATCQVTVTSPLPDLTVSTASYNIPATVGQPVTMPMTVLNQGAGGTGAPFTTTYYFQSGSAFNTGTVGTAAISSGTLGAGGSSPTTQSFTFNSPGTYYYWVCADNLGVISESNEGNNCGWGTVNVTAAAQPVPTCTFSASPVATVPSTLTWSSTNATSCTGGGFSTGVGSPTVGSASVSTAGSYTLTCTGAGGTCTQSLSVGGSCSGTRTGTVTATPNRVRSNVATPVTFTLSAIQNVQTSCVLSGPGVSQTFTASSCVVPGASTNQTITLANQGIYTLTCDGVKTSTAIVNILPNFTEF